jgi:hypothetical protein
MVHTIGLEVFGRHDWDSRLKNPNLRDSDSDDETKTAAFQSPLQGVQVPSPSLRVIHLGNHDSLREKRSPLEDISPVNQKRSNVASNAVTPVAYGDGFKFPNGLYSWSYLPIHEQEHFVRSSIDWRWKHNDGV